MGLGTMRLGLSVVTVTVALVLHGCRATPAPTKKPDPRRNVVAVGDTDVIYYLDVPDKCRRTACPVVVLLGENDGAGTADLTGFDEMSERAGFVLVSPSTGDRWGRLGQTLQRELRVQRLDGVIDAVLRKTGDPARVYLVGSGSGAPMAHTYCVERPDKIAAMAEAGGTIGFLGSRWEYVGQPDPRGRVSVMMMHGLLDDVVSYDMRTFSVSAPDGAEWWASHAAKGAKPKSATLGGGAVSRKSWVAEDGIEVALLSYRDLAHEWPAVRDEATGIDTNGLVWEFLSRHSLPKPPTP